MRLGDPAGSVEVRRPAYGDRLIRIDIDNWSPGQGRLRGPTYLLTLPARSSSDRGPGLRNRGRPA